MFYDTFLELCASKGDSPSGVAKKIGLSNAAASGWKNGKMPSQTTIIKLADYFHVSPDFLTGVSITSEGWEKAYREYLSDILPTLNRTDLNDANIDPNKLEDVADGTIALTFNLACEIADELGLTVDEMISDKNKNRPTPGTEDGLTDQESLFLSLIRRLTEDQKDFLLAQLKTLIGQEK